MVCITALNKYLHDNYYYDEELGLLRRSFTHKQWPIHHAPGTVGKKGYKTLYLFGKRYYLHQLIYLYHHGYIPDLIDHDDTDKLNNKIENLFDRDKSFNGFNMNQSHRDNKLGVLGVHQRSDTGKFVAQCGGKRVGEYLTVEEAKEAYDRFKSNEISATRETERTLLTT